MSKGLNPEPPGQMRAKASSSLKFVIFCIRIFKRVCKIYKYYKLPFGLMNFSATIHFFVMIGIIENNISLSVY